MDADRRIWEEAMTLIKSQLHTASVDAARLKEENSKLMDKLEQLRDEMLERERKLAFALEAAVERGNQVNEVFCLQHIKFLTIGL